MVNTVATALESPTPYSKTLISPLSRLLWDSLELKNMVLHPLEYSHLTLTAISQ
jgi:hypothetical protein